MLVAPLLAPAAAVPQLRPLAARAMTRIAIGGRHRSGNGSSGTSVDDAVADAYRAVLARVPEAAVADAIACLREHEAAGHRVVVATGCEETLARGFLTAVGLGHLDVVGSTGSLWPPRVRRVMGGTKVARLTDRGHPPPWIAVYSDSPSDVPIFTGTQRPVLVNADEKAASEVERALGRRPETARWR